LGALQQRRNGDNARMAINALLVHGAGGGAWEWNVWARVLAAAGARAEAIELVPAAGGLRATRLADYVAQVRAAALALPAPRVLVGASLGGLLAARVADDVGATALVLVNPLSGGAQPPRDAHDGVVPWRRTGLERTRRAMPDADDAACLFAAARWRDESASVLEDARAQVTVRPACPVLVLASEHDDDVAPSTSRAVADAWGADFALVRGAGHLGPLLGGAAATTAELTFAWCRALRA
jgi:predicted alpha/beta hydrolase family esterase